MQPSDTPDPVGVPRIELRHEDMLDELHHERDGRANPDGSPRYKDLNPGPRQR